ncbi:MAG TPA: hypothetical protein VFR67_22995 [Pilimelia sp.]|nr:hypothetical protein [Pilimelia sp.]
MTGLREHLADMADEAKHYDVTEEVLKVAKRRQRLTRMAPAGVAAGVVLGVLAVWLPLAGGDDRATVPGKQPAITEVDAAGPAEPGRLDWLPRRWSVPDVPPKLPQHAAVGAGALVYLPCPVTRTQCPRGDILLTPDGHQYAVPGSVIGLSPDGRWLVYGSEDHRVLRDLTGTAVRPLGNLLSVHWSADSARLAVEPHPPPGANAAQIEVIELGTDRRHTVPIHDPDQWAILGLFPSGDLLLTPRGSDRPGADPDTYSLAIADGRTGARRLLDVSLTDWLAVNDIFGTGPAMPVLIVPGGGTLIHQLDRRIRGDLTPGDLLQIDTNTGQVLRRYLLPPEARALAGLTSGGGLLVRDDPRVPTVELLDMTTGKRRVVAEPPPGIRLLVRGATSWTPG